MVAVPVAALTENFSPSPLTAPPPFGTETDGRGSAALVGLSAWAEVELSGVPAREPTAPAGRPGPPTGEPVMPNEVPAPSGCRPLFRSSGLACASVITGRPVSRSHRDAGTALR